MTAGPTALFAMQRENLPRLTVTGTVAGVTVAGLGPDAPTRRIVSGHARGREGGGAAGVGAAAARGGSGDAGVSARRR